MKPKVNRKPGNYDDCQTPGYAINPLIPILVRRFGWDCQIWESADGEGNLSTAFHKAGFVTTIAGDIKTGQNFFQYSYPPAIVDVQITNPPYSQKLKYPWIEHSYRLRLPFALLMQTETLSVEAANVFFEEFGIEIIVLNPRINFKMPSKGYSGSGAQFPVCWFTWGLHIGRPYTFYRFTDEEIGRKPKKKKIQLSRHQDK